MFIAPSGPRVKCAGADAAARFRRRLSGQAFPLRPAASAPRREGVDEGFPKKRIVGRLRWGRTTVYRLAGLAEPRCRRRRPAGPRFEPFKDATADLRSGDEAGLRSDREGGPPVRRRPAR